MPTITKIAITGGPCAGKTSALVSIRTSFAKMGYKVITIPEPATELISNGITPWECSSPEEYQRCQMEIQIVRENMYLRAAQGMNAERILMVHDRGMLDNKCYMSASEFGRVIEDLGFTELELCSRYDAVFHLVSAAKGAEEYYGTASNGIRYESLEEAAALDDKFIAAWSCHPYLRVIGNKTDFGDKLGRLNLEIALFLGMTPPA